MNMEGFVLFDVDEGIPAITVTENGVTFNKTVVKLLGNPDYVRLFVNEETRQLALQVCEKDAPKSARFYTENKRGVFGIRWNKGGLNRLVRKLYAETTANGFHVDGTLMDDKMIVFDFRNARAIK